MLTQTLLIVMQKICLDTVVNRNIEIMGEELGFTDQVEYVIVTNSPPKKLQYYSVNRQRIEMLRLGIVKDSYSPRSSET